MIFVTVGMQLPFDRLIRAMDEIALDLSIPVIAQTGSGRFKPENMETHQSISPAEFDDLAKRASLIVSHAGIGTVLAARRLRKPLVLLPRQSRLGEHRNDHQLATANQLIGRPGIYVAMEVEELRASIEQALAAPPIKPVEAGDEASRLKAAIANFIETGDIT